MSEPRRHQCPVTLPSGAKCPAVISRDLLMCKRHWGMTPDPLRRAVWREYTRGSRMSLVQAQLAAISAVDRQLGKAGI